MKRNANQQERLYRWVVAICGVVIALSVIVVIVSLLDPGHASGRPEQTRPVAGTDPVETMSGDSAVSETQTRPVDGTDPVETMPGDSPVPETRPQSQDTPDPDAATLPEKADAEYERRLAATMVIGLTFEYPDFEIMGIYAASETPMEARTGSEGVYLSFRSGGEEIVLYSRPLEGERQTAGTMDLYAADLGFATFDVVTDQHPSFDSMTEIKMEELGTLINQSLLVSIYSR